MTLAIDVSDLSKRFVSHPRSRSIKAALSQLWAPVRHEHVAVDGISFRIERGERVAFVGPNGAGKSTTIKICPASFIPRVARPASPGSSRGQRISRNGA